jgi:hypothetical protein
MGMEGLFGTVMAKPFSHVNQSILKKFLNQKCFSQEETVLHDVRNIIRHVICTVTRVMVQRPWTEIDYGLDLAQSTKIAQV